MPATTPSRSRWAALALTAATVELTLTTAYIHLSLGGVLFTLNAIGYAVLAVALPPARSPTRSSRASAGCRASAWPAFTARHDRRLPRHRPVLHLGWVAKAVEVAILTLLAADVVRVYGSLGGLVRAATGSFTTVTRVPAGSIAGPSPDRASRRGSGGGQEGPGGDGRGRGRTKTISARGRNATLSGRRARPAPALSGVGAGVSSRVAGRLLSMLTPR